MARIKKLTIGGNTYDLGEAYSVVEASASSVGLMTGADKIKLDSLKNVMLATISATDGYAASYQLTDPDGNAIDGSAIINIPKDQFLSSAAITEKDGESGEKYITLTFNIENGSQHSVDIPVTDLISSAFGDGLVVGENGILNVKVAEGSEDYLKVTSSGLKLSGIKTELDKIGVAQVKDGDGNITTQATGLYGLIQDVSDSVASLQAASKAITLGTTSHVAVSINSEGQYVISGDEELNDTVNKVKGIGYKINGEQLTLSLPEIKNN